RKDYPEIGGCYYASRLGVTEHLYERRKQATAILWREIYEGFNLPIGVWFVRENVREMFKNKPLIFDSIEPVFTYLKEILRVDLKKWLSKSMLNYNTIDKWLEK
ncbi:hypothetical protein DMP16_07905, partial [Sulfolobus sp. B1]